MKSIKREIRASLEQTFINNEVKYHEAANWLCTLTQIIRPHTILYLQVGSLISIFPTYIMFAALINEWIPFNQFTAGIFVFLFCATFTGLSLFAFIEQRVGRWNLRKNPKHEWWFVAR